MISNHSNPLGDHFIVSCHSPAFATSSEVLSGVKTECSRRSNRACLLPTIPRGGEVFGAVSLTGIFEDQQVVFVSDVHDGIHFAHLTVEMHWKDRLDPLVSLAQIIAQSIDAHVECPRVDIDEMRRRAGLYDRLNGCDERIRYSRNDVAFTDSGCY